VYNFLILNVLNSDLRVTFTCRLACLCILNNFVHNTLRIECMALCKISVSAVRVNKT
jgi:hypothetical protein